MSNFRVYVPIVSIFRIVTTLSFVKVSVRFTKMLQVPLRYSNCTTCILNTILFKMSMYLFWKEDAKKVSKTLMLIDLEQDSETFTIHSKRA